MSFGLFISYFAIDRRVLINYVNIVTVLVITTK